MQNIDIVAIYVALNLLIMIWLAVNVGLGRVKHRVNLGSGGVDDMEKRMRAHGNATEYIPAFLVGLVVAAQMEAPAIALHGLGGVFTLGRVMHGLGLPNEIRALRAGGIILTWLCTLVLIAALIFHALV